MEKPVQLLKVLKDNGIDFVIVGGFASTLHGSLQVTQAIDLCLKFSRENVLKLRECLAPFHPIHRMTPQKLSFIDIPADITGLKNLYLDTSQGLLDLLSTIKGIGDFETVSMNAIEIEIHGQKYKILSVDALIEAKKAIGRPKDFATIRELKCIQEQNKK